MSAALGSRGPEHSPTISGACPIFPADNPWNTDSGAPLDPRSGAWVASLGSTAAFHPDFGSVYGIPYAAADASTPRSPVTLDQPGWFGQKSGCSSGRFLRESGCLAAPLSHEGGRMNTSSQ